MGMSCFSIGQTLVRQLFHCQVNNLPTCLVNDYISVHRSLWNGLEGMYVFLSYNKRWIPGFRNVNLYIKTRDFLRKVSIPEFMDYGSIPKLKMSKSLHSGYSFPNQQSPCVWVICSTELESQVVMVMISFKFPFEVDMKWATNHRAEKESIRSMTLIELEA